MSLRALFGQLSKVVEGNSDRIAKRAVQIGGIANSTERVVATWSHLLCTPDALNRNHAQTIAIALASFGDSAAHAIAICGEFGDHVSANIFKEISQEFEEWGRKLEAL